MNDLTRINGIGPATARALAVAGIETIPALAAADPEALAVHEAFRGLRASPGDLANWIAEAQKVAGKPDALKLEDAKGGEDSARADAADSAAPPDSPPEPTPGAAGAGQADSKTPPPAPAPEAAPLEGFVLVVTGPKRGRRRAGMAFDATTRRIDASALTPGQIEALRDDQALSVEVLPAATD